jgi:hypothetical protein
LASPILTPALVRLRTGFTVRYRHRSTASDGWIGDPAHAQGTSGHNPDDTPGVSAERSDADSIPEVRSIDVDVDLIPGDRATSRLAMYAIIRAIISSPEDRRLIYIIFDGLIWSASRGWEPATYTGSNKHREHAHFSGHPDHDNDGSAWSVETGDDVTPQELINTNLGSPALGDRTVGDWWKAGESARREAEAAKNQAGAAATAASNAASAANSAATAAGNAAAEAALAKDAAGQAGIVAARVEGKVDELLARPPVELDYRELAVSLLQVIREEEAGS